VLTPEEIRALAVPLEPRRHGIYFLLSGDEVVYIGQSNRIAGRVLEHAGWEGKKFDAWAYVEIPGNLDAIEREYLDTFLPLLNNDPLTRRAKNLPGFRAGMRAPPRP